MSSIPFLLPSFNHITHMLRFTLFCSFILLSLSARAQKEQSWKNDFKLTLLESIREANFNAMDIPNTKKVDLDVPRMPYIASDTQDDRIIIFPEYYLSTNERTDSLIYMIIKRLDRKFQYSLINDCIGNCFAIDIRTSLCEALSTEYSYSPDDCLPEKVITPIIFYPVSCAFYNTMIDIIKEHPMMEFFRIYPLKDFWGIEGGVLYHLTSIRNKTVLIDGQQEYEKMRARYGQEAVLDLSDITEFPPYQLELDYCDIRIERYRYIHSPLLRFLHRKGSFFPVQLALL